MTLNDNPLQMAQSRYNVLLKRRQRLNRIEAIGIKKSRQRWRIYAELNTQMSVVSYFIAIIKGKPFKYDWNNVECLKDTN